MRHASAEDFVGGLAKVRARTRLVIRKRHWNWDLIKTLKLIEVFSFSVEIGRLNWFSRSEFE